MQVEINYAMFGATELLTKRNYPAMLVIKAITIVLVLLCLPHATHAQDYSKLPELPVWYELENTSFGKNMYYFPNFDTARGGINAFIPYFGANTPTIYNRYKGDTENMFNWGARAAHLMGDFNGDGIQDFYFQSTCSFYVGKKNGVPPDTPEVKSYYNDIRKNGFNVGYFKGDFDNDGKEDVLVSSDSKPTKEYNLGSIIFGNADLSKMQVVNLPHTNDAGFYQECILDAYTNNGKARMITIAADNQFKTAKLVLWEIQFITAGTDLKVKYNNVYSQPIPYSVGVNAPLRLLGINNDKRVIVILDDVYQIEENLIEHKKAFSSRPYKILHHYINNEVHYEYTAISDITNPIFNNRLGLITKGNPFTDSIPYAKIYLGYYNNSDDYLILSNAISVGDVNNDGFGDIAVYYDGWKVSYGITKFAIYLGIDKNVGVNEQPQNTTTKHIAISVRNAVVSKGSSLDVHATAEHSGTYTIDLYAMDGKKITTLWSGALQQGETDIPLPPLPTTLAAGRYNLMIDNGTQFNVCGVIVQ
ncbi:MAG: VCBS repeat-containing protein [Candidatus Kapabacteria bacterium]|nr:VCBS repeat-containing protein [Candidatus Kapabacteria bacterium]